MEDSDRSREEPSDGDEEPARSPDLPTDDAVDDGENPENPGDGDQGGNDADEEPSDSTATIDLDGEDSGADGARGPSDDVDGSESGESDEDGETEESADAADSEPSPEADDDGGEDSDAGEEDGEDVDADEEEAADDEGADDGEDDGADDGEDADEDEDDGADDGENEETFDGIEGPDTDEEMPLAEHIEEMMRRLAIVFLFGGLATLIAVTESTALIEYFWNYHIPGAEPGSDVNRPRLYGPLELPLTRLKVAGIAGVVVGLPAFVYQTYRFMKPGLYSNERRYYLAAVPTSLVLGSVGVAFAHFLVLPAIFSYFTTYTEDAATVAFGLAETFNLIVVMLAFMAIVFQIPLFIMLAIMMNLVTRRWLEQKRLIFWGAFLGIAFIFSPDPTGMAPIIVTLTMIVLYEGTLAILRWTGN
ncbi:hypothetical protein JCM17823_15400 [Halorubrum gandharaense]